MKSTKHITPIVRENEIIFTCAREGLGKQCCHDAGGPEKHVVALLHKALQGSGEVLDLDIDSPTCCIQSMYLPQFPLLAALKRYSHNKKNCIQVLMKFQLVLHITCTFAIIIETLNSISVSDEPKEPGYTFWMMSVQSQAIISIQVCLEKSETIIIEPQDYHYSWCVGGKDGSQLQ